MASYKKMDDYCKYFYILEGVLKLIGLGIEKYFEDPFISSSDKRMNSKDYDTKSMERDLKIKEKFLARL